MCVSEPGGTNDIIAYQKTSLPHMVEKLPIGKFIICENVYVNSEHLVTPFSGSDIDNERYSTFNFYLSQLRIKIEQEFGFMTNKWRILRRPMTCRLVTTAKVILFISRFHNFVINNGEVPDDINSRGEYGSRIFLDSDLNVESVDVVSIIREVLVNRISNMGLTRPQHNVERNG